MNDFQQWIATATLSALGVREGENLTQIMSLTNPNDAEGKPRDLVPEDVLKAETLSKENEEIVKRRTELSNVSTTASSLFQQASSIQQDFNRNQSAPLPLASLSNSSVQINGVPTVTPYYGKLSAFANTPEGRKEAYFAGCWWLSNFSKNEKVKQNAAAFMKGNGIDVFALSSNDNSQGGITIPDLLSNTIIRLVEEYGSFRKNMAGGIWPMSSASLKVPRRLSGTSAYWVAEKGTTTPSNPGTNSVQLNAKKLSAQCDIPEELSEDSIIDIGNLVIQEFGQSFSYEEDYCGFMADGEAAHGGITGVTSKLKNLDGTIANIAGLTIASGNAYSEIIRGDLTNCKSKLPLYAMRHPSCRWYMSSVVWAAVVEGLMLGAGGNTAANWQDGADPKLLGFPVELVQVMPMVEANSQVCILFGALPLSTKLGDRRGMRIKQTTEGDAFDQDFIRIKATERIDIVVHDVGNSSATAGLRVAGPMVGLITAAS